MCPELNRLVTAVATLLVLQSGECQAWRLPSEMVPRMDLHPAEAVCF